MGNAFGHLSKCRRRADAKALLKRWFEWQFEGNIRTPLPELPPLDVPEHFKFSFAPNRLRDGALLDWDLYLLNALVQSGRMNRTHLLRQMIGAFVTPFFGLGNENSFPWHRFHTLWLFADTARSMCHRLYQLMAQNGQIGAQDASGESPGGARADEDERSPDGAQDGASDRRAHSAGAADGIDGARDRGQDGDDGDARGDGDRRAHSARCPTHDHPT